MRSWRAECECGQPKEKQRACCSRCKYLDGGSGQLVAELRTMGGVATVDALAHETGLEPKKVSQALRKLQLDGRLVARSEDDDPKGKAVYVLVTKRQPANDNE